MAYDANAARAMARLAKLGIIKLKPSADGTAIFVTREGWTQLKSRPKTLANPAPKKELDYLRAIVRKSCGNVRPVREQTRAEFGATVQQAREKRDAQRARAGNACRGSREAVRVAKGTKPRVSAAERSAEQAQQRDAEMKHELRNAADWATWKKTGGGAKWKGPRWREQFFEFLHDEGNARFANIETPDDSEFAQLEREWYARQKRA